MDKRGKFRPKNYRRLKNIEIIKKKDLQYTNHIYDRFSQRVLHSQYDESKSKLIENYIKHDLRGSNIRRIVRIYDDLYVYTKTNREYRINNSDKDILLVITIINYSDKDKCIDVGKYRVQQKLKFESEGLQSYINHKNKLEDGVECTTLNSEQV